MDLCAGDARQKLHRKGDQTGIGQRAQRVFMAVRVHDGDDDSAALETRQFGGQGATDLKHDIGAVYGVRGDRRAGGGKIRIEDPGFYAGARLDGHFGAKPDDLLDGLGRRRDPRLAGIDLGSHRNFHEFLRRQPGSAVGSKR